MKFFYFSAICAVFAVVYIVYDASSKQQEFIDQCTAKGGDVLHRTGVCLKKEFTIEVKK